MPKTKKMPDATTLKATLVSVRAAIQAKHDEIVKAQGKNTYGKALAKLEELLLLKQAIDAAAAKKAQLEALSRSLFVAGASIDASIRAYVESIISALRTDTNTFFEAIQGGAPCPVIKLELPPSDEVNQRRLSLVIDFGPRMGVPPSGYLSDSQIHTLALSLRLAAIKRLNKAVAVIVLDDVVTSYDVDHRRYIAATIAGQLRDFQVIVVTHDERFFASLKDVLPQASWDFRRITALEPDYGPRFADHKTKDREVEETWRQGNLAANLIRQAEEEWLRRICLEFGVDGRMKEFGISYERSEYAEALIKFFKDKAIAVPPVDGVANPFLTSLRAGVVENFGSHFQDNQYALASVGDEQRRWTEFKQFRDMFKCPSCGKLRFERPGNLRLPVCKACQTPFSFTVPRAAASTGAAAAPAQGAQALAAPIPAPSAPQDQ
jgi:hypothetical protein